MMDGTNEIVRLGMRVNIETGEGYYYDANGRLDEFKWRETIDQSVNRIVNGFLKEYRANKQKENANA